MWYVFSSCLLMRTVSCSKNANAMYALFVIMALKSWNLNLPDNMATPLTQLVFFYPLVTVLMGFYCIECFHMTSWWPYWCPKTMKQRPCWCPKPIMWELNSFVMQTLSFVPINLHRCWPREWKHSIVRACFYKMFAPLSMLIPRKFLTAPITQQYRLDRSSCVS